MYVDALGATGPYEKLLSSHFPLAGIDFTVTAKADSEFKIVGSRQKLRVTPGLRSDESVLESVYTQIKILQAS